MIGSIDPRLPVTDVATLNTLVDAATARTRIAVTLLLSASGAALLLGAIGLYSVVAFAVAGRTREFAVRLAVGATGRSIVELVFREGLVILGAGVAAGLVLSVGGVRLIRSGLYESNPHDLAVYAAAVGLVVVTAATAIYLPARRAAATDPARVLRAPV